MTQTAPIRLGLAGLGGYAGYMCDRIFDDAKSDSPSVELVAACDPALDRFGARVRDLTARGVKTVHTFEQLLACDIEAVWLPLPIDLHRPFTEAALAAGKAVMCEKPAAGCVDDVDTMIAARDRARKPVIIGFQDIYQPAVATLKQRLVSGEFGKALSATVIGCWPRSERYYGRNDWAGRIKRDGRWVMDSPASNALAHFVHLAMFLLGPSKDASTSATHVAAELYRANRIENFDTCSLRITLAGDIPLYVAYTHACSSNVDPVISIETENASIRYVAGRHIEILPNSDQADTPSETVPLMPHPHSHMFRAFQSCVRQDSQASVCASLEMSREHIVALNVISETTPIVDIPRDYLDIRPGPDHAPLRAIRDIVPTMQTATQHKQMVHETHVAPWSVAAVNHAIPANYRHFAGPVAPRVSVTTHAPAPRMAIPTVTR
jgi:predicted dehydrogenase